MGFFSFWGSSRYTSRWSWRDKCEDREEEVEEVEEEECEPKSYSSWGSRYSYSKSYWCKDLFCKNDCDDDDDDDCCDDPCDEGDPTVG